MAASQIANLIDDKREHANIDSDGTDLDHRSLTPTPQDALNQSQALAVDSYDKDRSSTTTKDALPPPYSHNAADSPSSPTQRSPNADGRSPTSLHQRKSSLSPDSTSADLSGVRVRTKGNDLKSGFPYHPRLFDLRVRPDNWQQFSDQVINATKLTRGDHAKVWAAAGGVALTGRVLTSAWVGKTVHRSIQENKVTTGLTNTSEDSLGGILQQWNQSYFAPLGLQAKLELSDSATRKDKQQSSMFRRPSLTYRNREERERKNEDRKFVIVVAQLADDSTSTEAHELVGDSIRAEMPVPGKPRMLEPELPGDTVVSPAELPTIEDRTEEHKADDLCAIAELPADMPVQLAERPKERPGPTGIVRVNEAQISS